MASSFGLSPRTFQLAALAILVATVAIILAAFGGYGLGKDAAFNDNSRDQILRQSTK